MTRTVTFPLQLSWDEIAYLFATLHARQFPGLDITLLPDDEEARKQTLQRGYEALRADGWLEEVEQDGRMYMDLNSWLLEYVAALADPEAVLAVTVRGAEGVSSGEVLIYFSDGKVLEVAPREEGLWIQAVATMAGALRGLADRLRLPQRDPAQLEVVLSQQEAKALAEGREISQYEIDANNQVALSKLIETRQHLLLTAQILLMKVRGGDVQDGHSAGLLVGGQKELLGWWMEIEAEQVHYITCDRKMFQNRLQEAIAAYMID